MSNISIYRVSFKTIRCRGHDRMVVRFTTTYAISAYHHWCCEFESRPWRGVQQYVIKFVSDLRQVGGLLSPGPPISSTNKTDRHDITEILLNTIKQTTNNVQYRLYIDLFSVLYDVWCLYFRSVYPPHTNMWNDELTNVELNWSYEQVGGPVYFFDVFAFQFSKEGLFHYNIALLICASGKITLERIVVL